MRLDQNFLKENNAKFAWHPGAHPADARDDPPKIIVAAEGVTMTDVDGHRMIDAVGGLWNANLGHSCTPVKAAIRAQLDQLPYTSPFGYANPPAIELSRKLAEFFAPEGMARAFFTSGGSDGVDTALRLARQLHKIRGEGERTKFISFKKGYHGTHFGGASVNGNPVFRRNYEPLLPGCFQIPAPYLYRNAFGATTSAELARLCAAALEDEILFQGPDTVAAFIMEPVLGGGGVIAPPPELMATARRICARHGVLFIADEVITGFGRTGAWSGCRHSDVQPDLMVTAKAITNGYFPFGAVMLSQRVAEVFEGDDSARGFIGHGYTSSAHPVGAAAALACLDETMRLDVAARAAQRGDQLLAAARALQDRCELIGDVRGRGLMMAIELVSDRATKAPLGKERMMSIFEALYGAGVIVRINANNIILSPPLILSAAEADVIIAALDTVLASAR